MNCRAFEVQVAEYVAGRLNASQAARMAAHVAHCPHCAGREAEERALRHRFQSVPLPVPGPDLWPQLAAQIAPREARSPRFQLPRHWAYGGAFAATAICALLLLPHGLTPSTAPDMDSSGVVVNPPIHKTGGVKPNNVVKPNVDEVKVARMVSVMRQTTFDESDSLAQEGSSDQEARLVLLGGQ